MGKAKKIKPSRRAGAKVALGDDIESSKYAKSKNRNKIRLRKDEDEEVSWIGLLISLYSIFILFFSMLIRIYQGRFSQQLENNKEN